MASRLQDVIGRGLLAARPAATTVAPGTLYYSTDTQATERSDGTVWQSYTDGAGPAVVMTRAITFIIDGGGSVITTGLKAFVPVPVTGTIVSWEILSADATALVGSIVLDIWKDVYGSYPPTVADTITAAAKPTLLTTNKNQSSTLTGWTTSITAGDVLAVNVDFVTTVTRVILQLVIQGAP